MKEFTKQINFTQSAGAKVDDDLRGVPSCDTTTSMIRQYPVTSDEIDPGSQEWFQGGQSLFDKGQHFLYGSMPFLGSARQSGVAFIRKGAETA